jgi:hypothetical protein
MQKTLLQLVTMPRKTHKHSKNHGMRDAFTLFCCMKERREFLAPDKNAYVDAIDTFSTKQTNVGSNRLIYIEIFKICPVASI